MGRWKSSDGDMKEEYRRINKCVSLPRYLVRDLEAQGNVSAVITQILEKHKDIIQDGVSKDFNQRKRELLTMEIESILRQRLPKLINEVIDDVVQSYAKKNDTQGKDV